MDSFCSKYVDGGTVLLIGVGYDEAQYKDFPTAFVGAGASEVRYLEVWEPYYEKWRNGQFPITLGDARNIKSIFGPKSWDVVTFIQGPEHLDLNEVPGVVDQMFDVSRKAILLTCPYGGYYDYQESCYGNPYEAHRIKTPMPEMFSSLEGVNIRTFGTPLKPDAQILMWKEHPA